MSYALLPRNEQLDPEQGNVERVKARVGLPLPFSNARLLVRIPKFKVILASITSALLFLSVFEYAPSVRNGGPSLPGILRNDDSATWATSFRVTPRLIVPTDGEALPLKEGTLPARWPEDYPEAAKILADNSKVPDTSDPWPEKPWIASIWLSPDRFPDGLDGQPHNPSTLPEAGQEHGQKPSPGLHDPPIPNFPTSAREYTRLQQVPRKNLTLLSDWRGPASLPRPRNTTPVQSKRFKQSYEQHEATEKRRQWVKRAFLHAYEGYKANAFGHDEIMPVSRKTRDSYNAWGATTVDSLYAQSGTGVQAKADLIFGSDLLLIMNLTHEYNVARTHVQALDFSLLTEVSACNGERGPNVHLFETVIRYLGGLLSAFDLSGDKLMLRRAQELGDWLLPAFNTASGWPVPFYNLGDNPRGRHISRILAAEVGSLSMELTRLSQITGDLVYYNVALRIQANLSKYQGEYGSLVPHFLSPDGNHAGDFTVGGMIDSYYEYQIKMVQLLGDADCIWGRMYRKSVKDIYRYLAINVTVTPDRSGVVLLGARARGSAVRPVEEHLATFAGGMFGLGSQLLSRPADLHMAIELTESSYWAYRSTATGLMPEIMEMYAPGQLHRYQYITDQSGVSRARQKGLPLGSFYQQDREYKGRPESIESIFYMYRITGDAKWQEYGWRMFTSWVKHSLTSAGFANIRDVNVDPPTLIDIQESFVLTGADDQVLSTEKTLKYYYLLFSPPDLMSLDDYVFNTEAHPFILPGRERRQQFWAGPDRKVDAAYADPRDRHFFESDLRDPAEAPVGRGTARQQLWREKNC